MTRRLDAEWESTMFQRFMQRLAGPLIVVAIVVASTTPAISGPHGDILRSFAEQGRTRDAVAALSRESGRSDEARLALGFGQFIVAVENLAQGLHRFGMKAPHNAFLPIMRLPLPANVSAEPVDYDKLRAVYQTFLNDLTVARTTLLSVKTGDAKVVLDLNAVRLRFIGGASVSDPLLASMSLNDMLGGVTRRGGAAAPPTTPVWEIAFDTSDAIWLAGYTHILSAMFEFVMAHDWRMTFDASAHLFFTGAKAPAGLQTFDFSDPASFERARRNPAASGSGILDQIAFLHLIHWPAGDKARMSRARAHLKSAVANSRVMWTAVLAETDDDREWLPSPTQKNRAVPGMPITTEMVAAWSSVLDDFDALLDGRKLLGHWRFDKGIDMKAFFEDPKSFDLVLWVTGHGAMPFLRDGPTLDGGTLAQWNRMFGNNFLGYAFFVN
jgi:hypothetical protein